MNNENIKKRVEQLRSGQRIGPLVLEFNAEREFNWDYSESADSETAKLPESQFLELVEEACNYGAAEIRLGNIGHSSGTELSLAMMRLVKKKGARGVAFTNGWLLTKQDIDQIIKLGWDELVFSLDTADASLQDKIKGKPGTYEKTLKAIRDFASSGSAALKLKTMITRPSFGRLEALIELAAELGISEIFFDSLAAYKESKFALDENERKYLAMRIPKLNYLLNSLGIRSNIHVFRDLDWKHSPVAACALPSFSMVIDADGGVKPCSNYPFAVDNIIHKRLVDVWHGKPFERLRHSECSCPHYIGGSQ